MARLVGPDEGSRLVYAIRTDNTLSTGGGMTATVYADAGATTLADILTYPGGVVVAGSVLEVGASSLLPLFQFPDGVDVVYVRAGGEDAEPGPVSLVYARNHERLVAAQATADAAETPAGAQAKADAAQTASVQRAANLSDLASAATARTNLGLGNAATRDVGTTAGTVAAGDDSRIRQAVIGRKFGRLPSRSDYARLGGRSSTFATVTTNLTSGAQSTIPLSEPLDRSTIILSGGAALVPPIFDYGLYDITYRLAFTGGTVGLREARLLVDGVQKHATRGYGGDVTVTGIKQQQALNAGQVVSLAAYAVGAGAAVTADGFSGVLLTVEAAPAREVTSSLVGWSWTADIEGMGSRDIYGTFLDRTSWSNLAAPLGTGTAFDTWVAANRNRAAEITGPLVPTLMPGIVLDTALDEVTAGTRDAAFTALGVALAQYGPDTVYYRMFHEMNYTSLYPMTVSKFIAAWDHAVPLIRSGFASAARAGQTLGIVWCFGGDSPDPSAFFPAAANVDVVSVDTYLKKYNAPATGGNVLDAVRTDLARVTNIAAANSKPAAISEWANVAVGPASNLWNGLGDWLYGIDFIFDAIERNGFIYSLYFNLAGGGVGQTMADIPISRARYIARASLIRPGA